MKRRILALFVALTMILAAVPVAAAPSIVEIESAEEIQNESAYADETENAELAGASNVMTYSLAADGEKWVSKNFQVKEFRCGILNKCPDETCDTILIDAELVTILQNIRDHFGEAVIINAGYRCEEYNGSLSNASKTSSHMKGMAADIRIKGGVVTPQELAVYAATIGVKHIGRGSTYVHIGTEKSMHYYYGANGKDEIPTFFAEQSQSYGPPTELPTPEAYKKFETITEGNYRIKNGSYYISAASIDRELIASTSSKLEFAITKDRDFYKVLSTSRADNYNILNVGTKNSSNGSPVTLWTDTTNPSQRWYFEKCGDGYLIHPADNVSLSLTRNTSTNKLYVNTTTKASNQIWTLENNNQYNVSFNPNGGTVSPTSKTVTNGSTYGTLPTPSRTGYTFDGWYTQASGGTRITSSTTVNLTGNQTLYAHWKSTATTLTLNTENTAEITTGGQMVYYEYTPDTTDTYTIFSTGNYDTRVYLYDSNGNEIASDDDNGYGSNFRLEYQLNAGTTYKFAVKMYNSSTTGDINFWFGKMLKSSGSNGSGIANITTGDQIVYLEFTPSYTKWYEIYTSSSSLDTMVYLYDENGNLLDSNDDGGEDRNFHLKYQLNANTKYMFGIRLYGPSATGNIWFTLDIIWYNIFYNTNGGNESYGAQTKYHNATLTIPSRIPTRDGCIFLGWSTSPNGSVEYSPGDSYTANANVTLYAVWRRITSALTANWSYLTVGAIATGGEMDYYEFTPSQSGKYVIYSNGTTDTQVFLYDANINQLAFDDDSGEGQNFRLTYDLTAGTKYIYGMKFWDSSLTGDLDFTFGHVYTVTYNANGGIGLPENQIKEYGTNLTLRNTFPTKTSYNFLGWSTSPNGSVEYSPGDSYTANANVTLYAVWELNAKTCTVTFNAAGGTVSPKTKTVTVDSTYGTLPTPIRENYTFDGWYTMASGGDKITKSTVVHNEENHTLYAHWYLNRYTVTFDANGGSGAPASQTKVHNTALVLSDKIPVREGCKFLGWSTGKNGNVAYAPGEKYAENRNVTLYAVWLADISQDGKNDGKDVTMVADFMLGNINLNDNMKSAVDIDGNGKINIKDLIALAQLISNQKA